MLQRNWFKWSRWSLSFTLFLSGLSALVIAVLLLLPVHQVEAQCGSQASSCKNCHEVQGKDPVNSDGTGWHESHAFGDFCYICHAGNQQSPDEATAHAGMVPPLSDVKASCQMCHADDLTERAQVYATILNVDLGSSSGDTGSTATSEPSSDNFWAVDPVATSAPAETLPSDTVSDDQTAVCPTTNNELIIDDASMVNYVQRYDEIVLGKSPVNIGNVALIVMIGLVVIGGGGFVILNEIRIHTSPGEMGKVEGEYPADVIEMLPALAALKTQPRRALKKILANPAKTDKVLGLIDTVLSSDNPDEAPEEHNS